MYMGIEVGRIAGGYRRWTNQQCPTNLSRWGRRPEFGEKYNCEYYTLEADDSGGITLPTVPGEQYYIEVMEGTWSDGGGDDQSSIVVSVDDGDPTGISAIADKTQTDPDGLTKATFTATGDELTITVADLDGDFSNNTGELTIMICDYGFDEDGLSSCPQYDVGDKVGSGAISAKDATAKSFQRMYSYRINFESGDDYKLFDFTGISAIDIKTPWNEGDGTESYMVEGSWSENISVTSTAKIRLAATGAITGMILPSGRVCRTLRRWHSSLFSI